MTFTALNVASGQHPTDLPGWVNVDLPWDGVDRPHLFGDAFALPFPDGHFDRAYVGHFLEHLWWREIEAFVSELERVMAPGAEVMFVGPCMAKAVDTDQPPGLLRAIIGGGIGVDELDGPGAHKWIPTEALTMRALTDAGVKNVTPVDVALVRAPEWPNPSTAPWQCALLATMP